MMLNTKKVRDSNMELLRLLAMLLVLIFHADFLSLGTPTLDDIGTNVLGAGSRFFIESLSVVCVNVFVLLSGWYGIKPKTNRLLEFLFQVTFITILSIIVNIIVFGHAFCFDDIKNIFMLNCDVLWFPKSYLLLYILSPVLNAFIEKTDKRRFQIILCCFLTFEFVYGWAFDAVGWFRGGYSTISFIGLYLLARYFHIYTPSFILKMSACKIFLLYILSAAIGAAIWFIGMYKGYDFTRFLNVYTSPFAVFGALLLLLAFSKMHYKNNIVNWIAASCFAVYLCHCAPNMLTHYVEAVQGWYANCSTLQFIIYTALLIACIYVGAILVDKIRIVIWNILYSSFAKKLAD